MKEELLSMQGVFAYHTSSQLHDFHIKIYKGEIIELLGVSGSGKTALYEYLCAKIPADRGTVAFDGMTMGEGAVFRGTRDVICIGEKSTLVPGLSIAENLAVITGKRKFKGVIRIKQLNYRINLLLQQHAKEIKAEQQASELTVVQRHVVELLRAIENEVKLVYIDDIFSAYGKADMQRMEYMIGLLKENGITVVIAQRGRPEFPNLTDRLIVMRNGENVRTFYREDYDQQECQKWMVGNSVIERDPRVSCMKRDLIFQIKDVSGETYLPKTSIVIRKGELVGLYDMNNYANIELAEMIIGERPLASGYMQFRGKNYFPEGIDSAIHKGIGYFPANRKDCGVVETLDYADNLHLSIMLKMSRFGIFENPRVRKFLAREYKDKVNLKHNGTNWQYDLYSKTSIMFQKWILSRPDLLICEDILDDLDTKMQKIVYDALGELTENGCAVIVTSQKLGELKAICDTIHIMNSFEKEKKVSEIITVKNIAPF